MPPIKRSLEQSSYYKDISFIHFFLLICKGLVCLINKWYKTTKLLYKMIKLYKTARLLYKLILLYNITDNKNLSIKL